MTQPKAVYEHVQVKRMLHSIRVWFLPFKWGVNTYRGCEHDCLYCNARHTHEYLGLPTGAFAHRILVKDNAAEVLDHELSRASWKPNFTVNLATVTDPYQPAESRFKVTRRVLDVFLKHHNALLITTKSDLVLRDLDLLTQIEQTGFLNVAVTLSTVDEELRKRIEPNAPSVDRRLRLIHELHAAGITVGVTAIPLLPYLSDHETDVERLMKAVAENGADYVVADVLNLRGDARRRYLSFLQTYDSALLPQYEALYPTTYCDNAYAQRVRRYTHQIIKRFGVDQYDKMHSFRRG
jgi:DNA repair photolyase